MSKCYNLTVRSYSYETFNLRKLKQKHGSLGHRIGRLVMQIFLSTHFASLDHFHMSPAGGYHKLLQFSKNRSLSKAQAIEMRMMIQDNSS